MHSGQSEWLLRFVTNDRHEPFGHRTGIVHCVYKLLDARPEIALVARSELTNELNWLRQNMEVPQKFARSSRSHAADVAISWVKSTAHEHLNCLRQMQLLLNVEGVPSECLRTRKPGTIVYEDDHQVVALPFADTPC